MEKKNDTNVKQGLFGEVNHWEVKVERDGGDYDQSTL
jgi:hypothetical protein